VLCSDGDLAQKLISVYFTIFKLQVTAANSKAKGKASKQAAMNSRMLSALLTGVNRAFPYASHSDDKVFDEQTDTLFEVVHRASFATSVQALMLLFQVCCSVVCE
jgi:ribosome biogenesis protein MAK21